MENYIPFLIRLKKDTEKSVSFFESVYKPSYVENGHLSRLPVTRKLQRPTLGHDGQPYNPMCGLASDGVYRASSVTRGAVSSYLAFPPLPENWRFISVALSLESPPPDVIRHPALRSSDFPHLKPFGTNRRDHSTDSKLILSFIYSFVKNQTLK